MDITAAKTFLAIVETGSFQAAARRVYVTQSTVSARVKTLEQELGALLFIRTKSACTLTAAGNRFYRYARQIVRSWEEARHQMAAPEGFEQTLIIGGQYSLWTRFLLWWMRAFREASPHTAMRAHIGTPARLMRDLMESVVDLAVMHSPELRPGLALRELLRDELILVAAGPGDWRNRYVFVDWGEDFREWHSAVHDDLHNPGLTLDLGALGINYILNQQAAGYFPERVVRPHLENGLLTRIEEGPTYPYPSYVVWQESYRAPEVMQAALNLMDQIAADATHGTLPPPYWA